MIAGLLACASRKFASLMGETHSKFNTAFAYSNGPNFHKQKFWSKTSAESDISISKNYGMSKKTHKRSKCTCVGN